MVLNMYLDASHLHLNLTLTSECWGTSPPGWLPKKNQPIHLNGAIFTLCKILKIVAASAAKAELGALYRNIKEGHTLKLTLEELRHPQPATPIHCDNTTAVGITNGTAKQQRSQSMEMRYFYVCGQVLRKPFDIQY